MRASSPRRSLPLHRDRQLALPRILGDRPGDGVVEVPVEKAEFVRRYRYLGLVGQLGDGLAHAEVVVDDLRHGEAPLQEIAPVSGRALLLHVVGRRQDGHGGDELIQEEGDSALELLVGGQRGWPCGRLRARAGDDGRPVREEEFMEREKAPGPADATRSVRGVPRPFPGLAKCE